MRRIPIQIMAALVLGGVLVGCAAPSSAPQTPNIYVVGGRQQGMPPGGSTAADPPIPSPPGPDKPGGTRLTTTEPSPGSLAYLDFRNGFRDLKFGDPPTQDMKVFEEGGETKFYRRSSDDLTIGNANIEEISYGFYKGRLYSVLLQTGGLINSRALLAVLREAYGPGSRPNQFMDRYLWDGSKVLLYYDQKPISDDAITMFQSVPLRNEKAADEKAKARKGAGGL
jgi:hypothetical protein